MNDLRVGIDVFLGFSKFSVDWDKSWAIPAPDGVVLPYTKLFELCHDVSWLPGSQSYDSGRKLLGEGPQSRGLIESREREQGGPGSRRGLLAAGTTDYTLVHTKGSTSPTLESYAPLFVESETRPACDSAGSVAGVSSSASMTIQDMTTSSSSLTVNSETHLPSGQCTISGAVVHATLDHSYPADIGLSVTAPDGTTVALLSNTQIGDWSAPISSAVRFVFDDASAGVLPSSTPTDSGEWRVGYQDPSYPRLLKGRSCQDLQRHGTRQKGPRSYLLSTSPLCEQRPLDRLDCQGVLHLLDEMASPRW